MGVHVLYLKKTVITQVYMTIILESAQIPNQKIAEIFCIFIFIFFLFFSI